MEGAVALGSSVRPGLPAAGPHGGRTRCPPSARSPSRDCGPIRCCCAMSCSFARATVNARSCRPSPRRSRPPVRRLTTDSATLPGGGSRRVVSHEPAPRPNLRPDLFRVLGLTCLDRALHAVVPASSGCPARPRPRGDLADNAHRIDRHANPAWTFKSAGTRLSASHYGSTRRCPSRRRG